MSELPPEASQAVAKPDTARRTIGARLAPAIARLKRPLLAVAAAGTVVSGLAGYWNAYRTLQPRAGAAASPAPAAAGALVHRMSFAVLPATAPSYVPDGGTLARLLTEQVQASQEQRTVWVRVTPLPTGAAAAASAASPSAIGRALGVQYLLRSHLEPSAKGLVAQLEALDADSERVLGTASLPVDPKATPPAKPGDLEDALGRLTYTALLRDVQRSRSKPDAALDVGELAFRAFTTWGSQAPDAPTAYAAASGLIDRALAKDPDDLLSLRIKAQMNLCECLAAWAKDADAKERIGIEAMNRLLVLQPHNVEMLDLRGQVFLKHAHYDDALSVANQALQQDPDDAAAMGVKALALLRLDRPAEALPLAPALLLAMDHSPEASLGAAAAAALFEAGDDPGAAQAARQSAALLTRTEWRADPLYGSVVLTVAAAEARRGHLEAARLALADFRAAVPGVRSVAGLRQWLRPHSPVPQSTGFFAALGRAGLPP